MAQVVLHELERDAGVEQVRRNRMPQAVTGVPAIEPTAIAVACEQGLDLPLLQGTVLPGEQRHLRRSNTAAEVTVEEVCRGAEQRPLRPRAALQSLDDNAFALEVHIAARDECHLSHAQSVEIDQGEQRLISRLRDHREEPLDFRLREVARQLPRAGNESERRSGG